MSSIFEQQQVILTPEEVEQIIRRADIDEIREHFKDYFQLALDSADAQESCQKGGEELCTSSSRNR